MPTPPARSAIPDSSASLIVLATAVTWACCASVAVAGILLPPEYYAAPPVEVLPPPTPQLLHVTLRDNVASGQTTPNAPKSPDALKAPQPPVAPAPPVAVPQLAAPTLTAPAVLLAPEKIEFAVPIEAPVAPAPVAPPKAKSDLTPTPAPAVANSGPDGPPAPPGLPVPQQLIFGTGDGNQPKPFYPFRSQQLGQEGIVRVRFSVEKDGHVSSAQLLLPCRWDSLNESALSTVRRLWHFEPGPQRVFDVDIRFQLQ